MDTPDTLAGAWRRFGAIAGILAVVSYALAAFAPLPQTAALAFAFAFGPLVSVGMLGLYHTLADGRPTPLLQVGALLGIAAGVTVLVMLATQQAIFSITDAAVAATADPARIDDARRLRNGLNAVHFGIDVAWDVLISASVIIYGTAMLRHPAFGRLMGGLGIVLGALLLAFNLRHFPVPPANAESIDWGPFVALWMLTAFVMLLVRGRATA